MLETFNHNKKNRCEINAKYGTRDVGSVENVSER